MSICTHNLDEIPPEAKRTLENLLGSALDRQQHVLILTYTPSQVPSEDSRRAARDRIAQTLALAQQFAESEGISATEADTAIDDAMSQIRRRP